MKHVAILDHPFGAIYASRLGAMDDAARRNARARLLKEGLPGPKREEWRYTPLLSLAKIPFIPAAAATDVNVAEIPSHVPVIAGAYRVTLVNGVFRPDLSDLPREPGVRVASLGISPTISRDLPLVILNAAYMSGGVAIEVDAGAVVERPLHIVSIGAAGAEPVAFHPRVIVKVGKNAALTIFEAHAGLPGGTYFSNPVTDITIAPEGVLRRYVLVKEEGPAFHLATTEAVVASGGTLDAFHLGIGGGLVRQEIVSTFRGEDADVRLNGGYALDGRAHHDFTTVMNHDVANCRSNQVFKGVVAGESHGVYQGRVVVARDAQKTDAQQLHKALFLTRGPQIDCKPELEIYADDVKCGHGAATGELDPGHLFYLAARGIDPAEARRLLVEGFLADALSNVVEAQARQVFVAEIGGWLARSAGGPLS